MKKSLLSFTSLGIAVSPIVITVACQSKPDANDEYAQNKPNTNDAYAQWINQTIVVADRVNDDQIVNNKPASLDSMDDIFTGGRAGVALALGYPSGTSFWTMLADKCKLDPLVTYEVVKQAIVDALKSENPKQALASMIAEFKLPIDPITYMVGGSFGDASSIARTMLSPINNLYPIMVYGMGELIGINAHIDPTDLVPGLEIVSENPFVNLKLTQELPALEANQTRTWTVLSFVKPTAKPDDGGWVTNYNNDGEIKLQATIKTNDIVTKQFQTTISGLTHFE